MTQEERTVEYTDIQLQFLNLLKKYPVKNPETIVDYVTSQEETVLEDPQKLAESLSECEITPVRRRQILKHWFADKGVEVAPELLQRVALPPEQRKKVEEEEAARKESQKAKYSVDDETGTIKVATSSEKALTMEEAEKLSKHIKKEINDKGRGKPVTYVYDTVDRVVRMAKQGEVGGTMEQAKELKKMAEEGGKGAEESPFIQDQEGNWTLNPKARVTGVELMALESIRRAQERGEPVDPLEALGQATEKMKIYREALGGGAAQLPEWMRDPLQFQTTIQALAPKGETEALKEVREELTRLREDQHQAELKRRDEQIAGLTNAIQEYRSEVSKLKDETEKNRALSGRTAYDLIGDLVNKVPDKNDIRQMVSEAISKGPKLLSRGAGEREKVLEGMATGIEQAAEVKSIEDSWWRLG